MTDTLDIINRIENAIYYTEDTNVNDIFRDAVDEIERLREWNAEIALNAREFAAENERLRAVLEEIIIHNEWPDRVEKYARAALEVK